MQFVEKSKKEGLGGGRSSILRAISRTIVHEKPWGEKRGSGGNRTAEGLNGGRIKGSWKTQEEPHYFQFEGRRNRQSEPGYERKKGKDRK